MPPSPDSTCPAQLKITDTCCPSPSASWLERIKCHFAHCQPANQDIQDRMASRTQRASFPNHRTLTLYPGLTHWYLKNLDIHRQGLSCPGIQNILRLISELNCVSEINFSLLLSISSLSIPHVPASSVADSAN